MSLSLAIWIDVAPSLLDPAAKAARSSASEKTVNVHQAADLYISSLTEGERASHKMRHGGFGWLQITQGLVNLNGIPLRQGDGAAITGERSIEITAVEPADFLLFDLA